LRINKNLQCSFKVGVSKLLASAQLWMI